MPKKPVGRKAHVSKYANLAKAGVKVSGVESKYQQKARSGGGKGWVTGPSVLEPLPREKVDLLDIFLNKVPVKAGIKCPTSLVGESVAEKFLNYLKIVGPKQYEALKLRAKAKAGGRGPDTPEYHAAFGREIAVLLGELGIWAELRKRTRYI